MLVDKIVSSIKAIVLVVGLFIVYSLPSFFLGMNQPFLLWLFGLLVIGLMIWFGKRQGYFKSKEKLLTKKNIKWVLGAFVVGRLLAILFGLLMGEVSQNDAAIQEMTKDLQVGPLFMLLCLLAPIGEEIIFRGVILNRISLVSEETSPLRLGMGLLVSSLLFSSVHLSSDLISFVMYTSLGALMGLVYIKTKRLECAMAVHFLNNFLPFLFLAFGT